MYITHEIAVLLLCQYEQVFEPALLAENLQIAGEPLRFGSLHHQLALPFGIEQIVICFWQRAGWSQSGVIGGNVGIVVDRCPETLFLEVLGVELVRLRSITRQYAAAIENMHAE